MSDPRSSHAFSDSKSFCSAVRGRCDSALLASVVGGSVSVVASGREVPTWKVKDGMAMLVLAQGTRAVVRGFGSWSFIGLEVVVI